MSDAPPGILYHYTSVDALLGIAKEQAFRLTNVFFMNDSEEQVYLQRQAIKQLAREPQTDLRDTVMSHLQDRVFRMLFCGSLSAKDDSLSQWRAYAADGRGIAIGFNPAFLRKQPLLMRVRYNADEQQPVMDECLQLYRAAQRDPKLVPGVLDKIATMFAFHGLYCKNPAFDEEEEYRLIVIFEGALSDTQRLAPPPIFYKTRNGFVVPFMIIPLLLDPSPLPIAEIVLGPKHPVPENEYSIPLLMEKRGFGRVPTRRSKASYR